MFHLLGILFIIIIAVLLIGLSIIGTVVRSVFGLGGQRTSSNTYSGNHQQKRASPTEEETTATENGTSSSKHKKLFTKEDGEYVDFEEIKE